MSPFSLLRCALLCHLLFQAGAARAAEQAGLLQLFEKAGVTRQANAMPDLVREALKEVSEHTLASDETARVWTDAAARAYAPQRIVSRLAERLAPAFTAEEQAELARFLDSGLGRKVVELEGSTQNADPEQLQAPLRRLQQNPKAGAARLSLYRDLDQATGGAESWVVERMNSVLVMEIALFAAAEQTASIKVRELKEKLEKDRDRLKEDAARGYAAAAAYAYRDLTDQELQDYIRVSQTPVWRKYTGEIIKGVDAVLLECAQAFTRELAISAGGQAL